jgi:hypothetical protein
MAYYNCQSAACALGQKADNYKVSIFITYTKKRSAVLFKEIVYFNMLKQFN